jgi:hypothetical protein
MRLEGWAGGVFWGGGKGPETDRCPPPQSADLSLPAPDLSGPDAAASRARFLRW